MVCKARTRKAAVRNALGLVGANHAFQHHSRRRNRSMSDHLPSAPLNRTGPEEMFAVRDPSEFWNTCCCGEVNESITRDVARSKPVRCLGGAFKALAGRGSGAGPREKSPDGGFGGRSTRAAADGTAGSSLGDTALPDRLAVSVAPATATSKDAQRPSTTTPAANKNVLRRAVTPWRRRRTLLRTNDAATTVPPSLTRGDGGAGFAHVHQVRRQCRSRHQGDIARTNHF